MYEYNKHLKSNSQKLRREMTPEERRLWYDFLKKLPIPAKRQMVIGDFIVDFYIPKAKLVIEVDGRGHLTREHIDEDKLRDSTLLEKGISVLRCSNDDIRKRFKETCDRILSFIGIKASDLK